LLVYYRTILRAKRPPATSMTAAPSAISEAPPVVGSAAGALVAAVLVAAALVAAALVAAALVAAALAVEVGVALAFTFMAFTFGAAVLTLMVLF
jgi:hypothetical protein